MSMTDWELCKDKYSQDYILYQQGRDAMSKGDLDTAIALLDQSAHLQPHFKTLELLGECLLKRGRYKESVIASAASAGLGRRVYRALFLLAQALEASGERDHAIEKLAQALEFKSDYKAASQLLDELKSEPKR